MSPPHVCPHTNTRACAARTVNNLPIMPTGALPCRRLPGHRRALGGPHPVCCDDHAWMIATAQAHGPYRPSPTPGMRQPRDRRHGTEHTSAPPGLLPTARTHISDGLQHAVRFRWQRDLNRVTDPYLPAGHSVTRAFFLSTVPRRDRALVQLNCTSVHCSTVCGSIYLSIHL